MASWFAKNLRYPFVFKKKSTYDRSVSNESRENKIDQETSNNGSLGSVSDLTVGNQPVSVETERLELHHGCLAHLNALQYILYFYIRGTNFPGNVEESLFPSVLDMANKCMKDRASFLSDRRLFETSI